MSTEPERGGKSEPMNHECRTGLLYLAVNWGIDVQDKNHRNDGEKHGPFAEEVELKAWR